MNSTSICVCWDGICFWRAPKLLNGLKCESKLETTEEQRAGACSLAHSTLGGKRACWNSRMGIGRVTIINYSHGPAKIAHHIPHFAFREPLKNHIWLEWLRMWYMYGKAPTTIPLQTSSHTSPLAKLHHAICTPCVSNLRLTMVHPLIWCMFVYAMLF
jgi:hypothetical protein